jgi:hypothetical protein
MQNLNWEKLELLQSSWQLVKMFPSPYLTTTVTQRPVSKIA